MSTTATERKRASREREKARKALFQFQAAEPFDDALTELTVRLTPAQVREVDALRDALNRGVIGRPYDREDVLLFCLRETAPGLKPPQTSYAGTNRERPIKGSLVG